MAYETLPVAPLIEREEPEHLVKIWEFDDRSQQSRPVYHNSRRRLGLLWPAIDQTDVEKLRAFVTMHKGAATPFYITKVDKVAHPYTVEQIAIKAGGALGSRTLYVGYTWSDGSNETTVSEVITSGSFANGEVLSVTVPDFPSGATQANVYVGTSAGALKKQTPAIIVSGGTWGEPETGYDSGGAAPPSTNGLSETPLVFAVNDKIEAQKLYAGCYRASLEVLEKK